MRIHVHTYLWSPGFPHSASSADAGLKTGKKASGEKGRIVSLLVGVLNKL